MKRILDLQKLEQPQQNLVALGRSTSSQEGCTCSTRSGSCQIGTELIAI